VLLGIDHLVIAVRDPDAAATTMHADLGLAVTGGGRHEHAGTFNRLAFLGDTYLELIGVFDRALAASSTAFAVARATLGVLDDGNEGLAAWAAATDDAAAEVERLRAAGSRIGDVAAGQRTRQDGEVVRWVTAFPEIGPDRPPFLIEHEPAGAEWGAEARAARAEFQHPAGGTVRLTGLTIPTHDPADAAARYRAEVGIVGADGMAHVGGQRVHIATSEASPLPIVDLACDGDGPPRDLVRFGVRWRIGPA